MPLQLTCKHGLPVTWDLSDWRCDDETKSYKQTVTVTMCKACVAEGAAAEIARQIESAVRNRNGQGTSAK